MEIRITSKPFIYLIIAFSHHGLKVSSTDPLDCDFEQDFCNWRQSTNDDFNWTRLSGKTPTNRTGPNADHTTGDGFYVYIDTSSKGIEKQDKAWIVSPAKAKGTYCLAFWYYMYGQHVERLKVFKIVEGSWYKLFALWNDNGQSWKLKQKYVNAAKRFKILIEGRVRNDNNHDLGDIAIDDVVMLSGPCPKGCGDPTPTNGVANSRNLIIGAVVGISCSTGYRIKGSSSIVCLTNGTWSDGPECYPEECGDPTPRNGAANPGNFTIGAVVGISCSTGFRIKGSSSIVCLTNGTWSDRPECDPKDCGTRTITNGHFMATSGTTFGETAWQSCNTGYILTGHETVTCTESGWNGTEAECTIVDCSKPGIDHGLVNISEDTTYNSTAILACVHGYRLNGTVYVTCQADGNWSTLPTCVIIDCRLLEIKNGRFTAASGTVLGRNATQSCNAGFIFAGDKEVSCTESGWSGNLATCTIVDCLTPVIRNGETSEMVRGTTYNSTMTFICDVGYTLTGSKTVTCQDDGNWTALPICLRQDPETSALIAIYVVVPIVVVALVVGVFVIAYRKGLLKNKKTCKSNRKHSKKGKPQSTYQFTNKIYTGHNTESQPDEEPQALPLPPDNEYAIISKERIKKEHAEYPVYYNTAGAIMIDQADVEHNYDHMDNSATQFFDTTYSHISKNKIEGSVGSVYNTTMFPCHKNESFQSDTEDESNRYDLLNVNESKDRPRTKLQSNMLEDNDPEYDHAKAGGIDPVDMDNYSHLNDSTIKPTDAEVDGTDGVEYANAIEIYVRNAGLDDRNKVTQAGYRPLKFRFEAEIQEPDRTNFVLKEEGNDDQFNDIETADHEYFVLEKTEC